MQIEAVALGMEPLFELFFGSKNNHAPKKASGESPVRLRRKRPKINLN